MKVSMAVLLSFVMIAAVMFPTGSMALSGCTPQYVSASGGNVTVVLSGSNAVVKFNSQLYDVNWAVAIMNGTNVDMMKLSNLHYSRMYSPVQNSLILTENNSLVKAAEIFSFYGGGVDSSISVKNLQHTNITIEALFSLKAAPSSWVQLSGIGADAVSSISGNAPAFIGSEYQSMILGQVGINWQEDASLFHAGMVSQSSGNSIATLPFGPVILTANETYSIDPMISPEVESVSSPSMVPYGPMSCIGGPCGGGGGGGGSFSPGGSTIVSVTPDVITPGTTVSIVAHANSVGSGGVTLHLNAYNETSGTWTLIESIGVGSSTGDITFQWSDGQGGTSLYDWSEIEVYASNSYGSGSAATAPIYSQTYFSVGSENVYDDSGTVIGAIVNSVGGSVPASAQGANFYLAPTATFVPANGEYQVNFINQSVYATGGSNSGNPQFGVQAVDHSYSQNSNSSSVYEASYLLDTFALLLSVAQPEALALTGASPQALIGYLALLQTSTSSTSEKSWANGWSYSTSGADGGYNAYMCARFGLDCYNSYYPIYIPGTSTPSYIFALSLAVTFGQATGGCPDIPYVAAFEYTTSMTITHINNDYADTVGFSDSMPFMEGDYQYNNNNQC